MKRLYIRAFVGFPLGICSAYLLSLLYSYGVGSSTFLSTLPTFLRICPTPLMALTLQTLVSGIIGSFAVSIITLFETPAWSNTKAILWHTSTTCILQILFSLILCLLPHNSLFLYLLLLLVSLLAFLIYRILLRNTKDHVAYLNMQLKKIENRGEPYDS